MLEDDKKQICSPGFRRLYCCDLCQYCAKWISFDSRLVTSFPQQVKVDPVAISGLYDDDLSLLKRIERRDDGALGLLYERYAVLVYSMALRVMGDPVMAEQVLSDIFLDVRRDPTRLKQIAGSLGTAMAVIARNRAVAMLHNKPSSGLDYELSPEVISNRQKRNATPVEACAAIASMSPERRVMLENAFFRGTKQSAADGSTMSSLKTGGQMAMDGAVLQLAGTGLEVFDLQSDAAFARRKLHVRDVAAHIEGMNRLARVFVGSPANILQELVTAAVDLCGADSAGISIEQKDSTDDNFYHWVATAGQYSGFVNAKLPRYPSACGVTLERGRPQSFRVTQHFFDLMGVQAPTVTDGLLLPWQTEETRGTIWIMAHGRTEAFDVEDCRMMQALANFAATGVRLQQQQSLLMEQARTAAASAMANNLAHQINNPLQGLMQTVFLFGRGGADSGAYAQQAMGDVSRLSDLVKRLLSSTG